uniref:Uncharacterized protein n=1 Tax=Hucho hucho TaxID=62062 RepID=A0A4W5PAY2_9TELE
MADFLTLLCPHAALLMTWPTLAWYRLVWFYPSDSTGGETKPAAPAAASGAELMAAFDGLGDVLMPSMTPQAGAASSPVKPMGGDLDATMASMASNLGMGTPKPGENTMGGWSTPQVAPPSWGAPMNVPMGSPSFMGSNQGFSMGGAVGAGAPMMPMVRPGFGAPATPGAPVRHTHRVHTQSTHTPTHLFHDTVFPVTDGISRDGRESEEASAPQECPG